MDFAFTKSQTEEEKTLHSRTWGADYLREFHYPMQMHFTRGWRVFHYSLKVPK